MTVEPTRRFILARVTQVRLPIRDRTSTPDLAATTPTAEAGAGVETAEVVATEVVVAAVISLRAIQLVSVQSEKCTGSRSCRLTTACSDLDQHKVHAPDPQCGILVSARAPHEWRPVADA